jgi:two-component system, LytTR family, sensor kinase
MTSAVAVLTVLLVAALCALVLVWHSRSVRDFGSPAERAVFEAFHTASLAAPPLRAGLTPGPARKAARHLRVLFGGDGLALTDDTRVLAFDGAAEHHAATAFDHARPVFDTGRILVAGPEAVMCARPDCPVRHAVAAPLMVEDRVVGSLVVFSASASAGLVRAAAEVARWASGQLELTELDRSKTRLAEAEVQALRAQISPHFLYNVLTAIASFVRTDAEHARELLLEFADFARYTFRKPGHFTTLAEELQAIDQYLMLERARFGERLSVTLRVAPEVLPVAVPFLCLQPLVENSIRHGIEGAEGGGHITIVAENIGADAVISIDDDGPGMDPGWLRGMLTGEGGTVAGMGLRNVDSRLRQVFGEEYGLVIKTAPGAGTKVQLRVPKYRAGVYPS